MPKHKITPKAKYPVQTQKFIQDISDALEEFEENIQFPDEEIREGAYSVLLKAYRSALMSIWSSAQFADTKKILKTISDRQMVMSKKLEPEPTTSKVLKEPKTVPDLEQLTESLKDSSGGLPSVEICAQIAGVFSKLTDAHRSYAEAAAGIAELSTVLNPPQYTMILRAAIMPTIQIVFPGNLVSPVSAPPPPPTAASTALGKSKIIKYTKHRVLPDPDSPELALVEENSATRVLAAAIYLKIENLFFDETSSRLKIAMAFKCNISQLTKAVTEVHYIGGPHHYIPKQKTGSKRSRSSTGPSQQATKKPKTKEAQASTSKQASTSTSQEKQPSQVVSEDTLSESSSSSDILLLGLLEKK